MSEIIEGRAQGHRGSALSRLDLPADHPFGPNTLPYGAFRTSADTRVGVAVGEHVLDLTTVTEHLLPRSAALFAEGDLDAFLAAGPTTWRAVRGALISWLNDPDVGDVIEAMLIPASDVEQLLPFTVADYVDFYASEHHATNVGQIFRPGSEPLTANWKHLPIGYHGRAGTVVVSGTSIQRPHGQRQTDSGEVTYGPTDCLDIEAELAFVVGQPRDSDGPLSLNAFGEHVFGVCLLNDWSARDIQRWEAVPLGPMLGKSFATSISPWIVPLDALSQARVAPAPRDVRLLPYLDDSDAGPGGLDIQFEIRLNRQVISRPPFASMYWTPAQQLAHLTSNGTPLRTGDLFASGTISGPQPDQRGSLLELTWNGATPITLEDGSQRSFLLDGDVVEISATAPGPDGSLIGLGMVEGTVRAAASHLQTLDHL